MNKKNKLIILGYNNIVERVIVDLKDLYDILIISSKQQIRKNNDINNVQKIIIDNPDEVVNLLNSNHAEGMRH